MRRRSALLLTSATAATAALALTPGLAAAGGSPAATAPAVTAISVPTTTATTSATTTTTTTTTTTPTAPTAPAAGAVKLYLGNTFLVHRQTVTVPTRRFVATGVVRPYVPGQVVVVKSFLGHKLLKTSTLRVKPSKNGTFGTFTASGSAPHTGILRVAARHAATAQQAGFSAQRGVSVLNPQAGFGARGLFVDLIQQRLSALHFYDPPTGVYDTWTGLALDAYHRLVRHGVSQDLNGLTVSELLNGLGSFHVRFPHDGTHIEGNLGDQLLAEIYGNKVYRIYPISSGKPSTPTVLGHFRVYERTPGYLPDGMYYSSFFYGGYAIHGFDPAPDYPASHGCMRLPIIDAISVYNWLTFGDVVDVYYP